MPEAAVEVRRISKSFDGRGAILRDVSFSLRRGEMVALIGASGSGRSTLVRAIAGLEPIDKCDADASGEIVLFGQLMQQQGRITQAAKRLRVRTGVVSQQFNLRHQCLPWFARPNVGVLRHDRPLHCLRQAPRHAGARSRRDYGACAQAGGRSVGRTAAVHRHEEQSADETHQAETERKVTG
jgi:ABC-type histidine transport system ATPase subunit